MQFSIGINAVDTFPTATEGQEALFEQFFNVADHWNIVNYPSQIGISNSIGSGFSLGFNFSQNSISTYGNTPANQHLFVATDVVIIFDIGHLFKLNRFSPFIETGGGYVFFNKIGAGYFNSGFGMEYALGPKKKTVVFAKSLLRNTGETYGYKHFQHTVGIGFRFGSKKEQKEESLPNNDEVLQDTDGDGVLDAEDVCPKIPGKIELNGCPDRDGDGIKDGDDNCPEQAGIPELNGCPKIEVVEESKTEPLLQIDQVVHFAFNSITLYQIAQNTLDEVVEILNQHPQYSIEIQANTDSIDTDEFNYDLSLKRAAAVKAYLISKGIEGERLKIKGFGESNPIRLNSSERGRALNRRVEFRVID